MLKKDEKELTDAGYIVEPLILKNYTHDPSMSLRDFVYNFLEDYHIAFDTFNLEGCKQTEAGKYRSLGDIFIIACSYYDNITLDQIRVILKNFNDLVGHICGDIERRVFTLKSNEPQWSLCSTEDLDEFGDQFIDNHSYYVFNLYD